MTARSENEGDERPVVPRDLYLPETGPARKQIRRPSSVPPAPPGLYLRENRLDRHEK